MSPEEAFATPRGGGAMTTVRITKVLCPCCEGTGISPQLGFTCMWCGGRKRTSVDTALRYANQNYVLAGAGYIEGDTLEALRANEAISEKIYAFVGKTPPWKEER